ncbi:MAG: class I SAM-dependent methyltransferase, partial [Candidatus Adiutrix sp.]|nr:class I SAM-dependent methyltransferase [Candidatus Adiutrix sp.]
MPQNYDESRATLEAEFRKSNLPLSRDEADKFWQLHELLEKRNPEGDLTRVRGFFNTLYKHYIDGALAAELIKPEGLTMDLGTGAGFPGLPIAIRRPQWPLLLAEPRGRRLAFMEEAVGLLGLRNVEFYPHKVGPRFDRPIENFITRDFESAADSLARAAGIIPPGGRVYLMKGPAVDEELAEARRLPEWDDFELEDDRAYRLGEGGPRRRLLTFRKRAGAARPAPPPPWRVVEIASRENARYKAWLRALSGRGLKKEGLAVISGRKFVAEILAAHPYAVQAVVARRLDELEGLNVPENLTVHLVRPELWPEL